MTSFFWRTSKIGYKLSPQSTKQQLFFIVTRKFVNVSMAMVYFVLATGLCINLRVTVTPNQIIGPSLPWKVELVRSFSLLLKQFYCLLPFIQVTNSAGAKFCFASSSSVYAYQRYSRSIIFQVHAYF